MRIRKKGKLWHGSEVDQVQQQQQPHVCLLNQSPWDVIPFSQDITYQSAIHQFERENNFDSNGISFHDSVPAVHRENEEAIEIQRNPSPSDKEKIVLNDDNEEEMKMVMKRAFKFNKGEESDNHLTSLKPYISNANSSSNESDQKLSPTVDTLLNLTKISSSSLVSSDVNQKNNSSNDSDCLIKKTERDIADQGARRGQLRAKAAKRARSANSNRHQFYYYSGFGPLWGKKKR